jgi:PEP-CTERM motif
MACAVKERMGWAIRDFHSTDKFGGPLMRIRPIALYLGVAVTPSFALTAHADAGYNVNVLQDPGGQGNSGPFFGAINDAGQSVGFSATASCCEAVLWSRTGKATVLQDIGGQGNSAAAALNNAGWSIGTSGTASGLEAVLWSPTGKGQALQLPAGLNNSQGLAINNDGRSVGTATTSNGGEAALLWSPTGKATMLRNAGGFLDSSVSNINDAGQSAGESFTFGQVGSDAVRWSPSGKATMLQAVGQGSGFANFINNSGWIAGGSSFIDATGFHSDAVLWSPSGKATVLQDVGGQGFSSTQSLNGTGQTVGFSRTASGQDAVLWSRSGKATVLQDAGGQGDSFAGAINDFGWSVGDSDTATGSDAVLWSPSGKATDLGAVLGPAWTDTQAVGINDPGDIVGTGAFEGGTFGFLLKPDGVNSWALESVSAASFSDPAVPEPPTWAMMLMGLMGLGFVGWRTRASKHASSAQFTRRQC